MPCGGKVPRLACDWVGCGDGCEQRLTLTVRDEARRQVDLAVLPTVGAIGMLSKARTDTNTVLHLTC